MVCHFPIVFSRWKVFNVLATASRMWHISAKWRDGGLALLFAGAICLVVFSLTTSSFFVDASRWGYDLLANTGGDAPAISDIIIVDFDDQALGRLGTYPIPRTLLAEVIAHVSSGRPELIGVDLLLSESRPKEDDALADALRAAGNVVIASQEVSSQLPPLLPLPRFCVPDPAAISYCKQPESAAFALGFANMPVDSDGIIRRMFLLPAHEHTTLPFAAVLARDFRGQGIRPGVRARTARVGNREIAFDDTDLNTVLIGDWRPHPARSFSATDVLASGFDPNIFAGKIVLIGQSNSAAKDRHFTPLFRRRQPDGSRLLLSGTEAQAIALATLLQGTAVRVLPRKQLWGAALLLVWLAVAALILLRPTAGVPVALLCGALLYAASQVLFSWRHLWLDFVPVALCLGLAFPAAFGYRFVEERWLKSAAQFERHQLMQIFSRYVSPELAGEIWKRRGEIVLAGEEKTATVLFSDIRDFTRMSAGKPSTEVLRWLNEYFTAMDEIIRQHGGLLNKFIGDGIMAVFGVPVDHGAAEEAGRAVQAALRMFERVEELRREHASDAVFPQLRIGVGIHTGPLTAGSVGSRDRLEYSVIGETVNLASRLEGLNTRLSTEIVISPSTMELVRDRFSVQSLGEAEIKGLGKVVVYTLARSHAAHVQ